MPPTRFASCRCPEGVPPRLERIRDLAVYRHAGDDPQIVLVHGAMDRGAGMLRVARQLRGRAVVRYDRRGYGRSVDTGPAVRFGDQVDDLRAIVADRPTVLFGHSYGGVIAMALAARFPGETFLEGWPDEALAGLGLDARTAVVTLTHDPKLDDPAIMKAVRRMRERQEA